MLKLTLETATVRIAAFPEGDRLLTVRATCMGPAGACAAARLVPRRHAAPPEDGLWDIDLVSDGEAGPADGAAWRDVVFTGEAAWCEGVRLHSPGGVLEHRIAPQAARLAPRAPEVPRWTPPAPAACSSAPARRPPDLFGLALDSAAAVLVMAAFSLLPMAMPANAAEAPTAPQAAAHADHQHFRLG